MEFPRINDAIAFEKSPKGKSRSKKIVLIEEFNPRWNDLAWSWFKTEQSIGEVDDSASRATRCWDSWVRSE
ncbi:MAG: hypothetical protein H0W23_04980 [Chloroflexia bacterium]|nr:hypothetical protein [Chloroflexia bacterium]